MKPARRLFAFLAIFAIAFGSLWPLVSAAKPRTPQIPDFICSQAGFQHAPAPAGDEDHFHCPLCVVTCDVALPSIATAHTWVALEQEGAIVSVVTRFTPRVAARPPPSHAPPLLP
jgi:hypothetical protein